jgi:hypothetical protein
MPHASDRPEQVNTVVLGSCRSYKLTIGLTVVTRDYNAAVTLACQLASTHNAATNI